MQPVNPSKGLFILRNIHMCKYEINTMYIYRFFSIEYKNYFFCKIVCDKMCLNIFF